MRSNTVESEYPWNDAARALFGLKPEMDVIDIVPVKVDEIQESPESGMNQG